MSPSNPDSFHGALIINEDNSHFYHSRSEEEMNETGLHAFIDQYADTAVTHLFLSPNAQRASFRSKTREASWDPAPEESVSAWSNNAKLLHERGFDPYAVWIDRSREKGISPWLSMRMNDIHNAVDTNHFMHSAFWRENPQFWVVPHAKTLRWQDRALDFQYPEVRQHAMEFLVELLERYDPDGIELDWMRFGFHFPPGEEFQHRDTLTAFMREARSLVDQAAKRRGHPIQLAARVPTHPDAARGLGMDAVQWAAEGLLELLIVAPFWRTTDYDIPLELWRERLERAGCALPVLPGAEHNTRAWLEGSILHTDLELLNGWAAACLYRGAPGLYLFNWMDNITRPVPESAYRQMIQSGLSRKIIENQPRRHPLTFRDTLPHGFPDNQFLPADPGTQSTFPIPIGPVPSSGTAELIVGLSIDDTSFSLAAILNGCSPLHLDEPADTQPLGADSAGARKTAIPLEHLVPGTNQVTLYSREAAPQGTIVWVEIRLKPA